MKRTLAYPYLRVSKSRRGFDSYGLEAQQKAVADYALANAIKLGKPYIEIESGRKNKRPVLQRAITTCLANKGLLLIARIDRLSRNVAFTAALLESKVEFRAVDNPHADKFTIHILSAVAEKEAEDISIRTKAALKVAKARGVQLGRYGRENLSVEKHKASIAFWHHMQPVLYRLQKCGFQTVRSLAGELNRRKVPTFYGAHHHWHPSTVHKLMKSLPETNECVSVQDTNADA